MEVAATEAVAAEAAAEMIADAEERTASFMERSDGPFVDELLLAKTLMPAKEAGFATREKEAGDVVDNAFELEAAAATTFGLEAAAATTAATAETA